MNSELTQAILAQPMSAVADYYASCLAGNTKALAFVCDELKLTPEQAAQQRVGFSDRSLGTQLPSKRIKSGREVREQLISLGLYKGNGRETLRGYVTMPVADETGQVIAIRGYKLDPGTDGPAIILVGIEDSSRQSPSAVAAPESESPRADSHMTKTVTEEGCGTRSVPTTIEDLTIDNGQLLFTRDDRHYRIRGLEKNTSTCTLRVNLMANRDSLVHLDSLDLVKARSRASYIKAAATELFVDEDIIKKDIGQLLLKLEQLQASRIEELKAPANAPITISDEDREAALLLLRDASLLDRIVSDLDACGIVGERSGKLVGYLAAVSRKLETPLALLIQSSSAAGKTSLMDGVLALVPEEDQLRLSNLTGQSLYYLNSGDIRHKILAISEDEGISQAAYALKLLQSEGKLTHATVTKGENGRMTTERYSVEGPVALFLTTTAAQIDEELANRSLVLSVDESSNQTRAIQSRQRDARLLTARQTRFIPDRIKRLHQNAQRLLQPLVVCNPYASRLTFASNRTRLRRDHQKYLTLIDTVALLRQHQRTIHTQEIDGEMLQYINVTVDDIAVAGGLAAELLGRSLDELSPQTRRFLNRLSRYVSDTATETRIPRDSVRFTRRDVRQRLGWSDFQMRMHLGKLVELEYVLPHRGKNGQRYVYELLYDGDMPQSQPHFSGLIDPQELSESTGKSVVMTPTLSISEATLSIP
jgi:hypothetical protein